jgi:hypothetical protein
VLWQALPKPEAGTPTIYFFRVELVCLQLVTMTGSWVFRSAEP